MDIDDIFRVLGWFSEQFPLLDGKINSGVCGRNKVCATGFRFRELLIIIAIFQGPRGGIREEITVVDPAQKIEADRLLLGCVGYSLATTLYINPTVMREEIAAGKDFETVASRQIEEIIEYAVAKPEEFRARLYNLQQEFSLSDTGYWSVRTVRG